ncbi:MAG: NUDIX domain-containing protein [Parafannyhessea sp.]|uniref:NUDIX domain-containing protein n=1 Tax=Parafannyhessea sp. TaxID=2847324 RepID=UPI003EFDCFF2
MEGEKDEDVWREGGLGHIRALLEDDPRLVERVVGETRVWDGRIFGVRTLDVELPDGGRGVREVVLHHGGAGVAAVRDGRICLVRQYRVAMGRMSLEIPAGKLDAGEEPERCAARELREETGLVAGRLEFVGRAAGSIGFTNETTSIYLAHCLRQGSASPDEGEFVDVAWLPVRDVLEAVRAGLIQDGKTIIGALAAVERGLA